MAVAGQREGPEPSLWDETIVERARGGDRLAFSALYERFAPLVHGVLVAGVPPNEVDDLMQEVFLAAWNGIDKLRQTDQVGAWLGAIARNRLRKTFRRRRAPSRPLAEDIVDPRASFASGEEILAVLRALPEVYRETLALRLVEGLSGPEIAAMTGKTPGSVRVNLCRGLQMLREKLRRAGWS